MDKQVESFLAEKFQGEDLDKIKKFMDQDFSLNGQIAIASIFVFAQEYSKDIDEVLAACQIEWDKNWSRQHPGMRGNPDINTNRLSLEDVYLKIGVPSPMRSL